jgi:Fe-S cluster biogenesis protein NfuA
MSDERIMQAPAPAREDVEQVLDRIRPGLIADGGNLELVGIDSDGTVRVILQGECAHCPAKQATLRIAVEEPLRRVVPGVTSVVGV